MIETHSRHVLRSRRVPQKTYDAIRPVVDAVCTELGIDTREAARRAAVEQRVLSAWRSGPRHPLNLVRAGLDG